MRINSSINGQIASIDDSDAGEGLAIFLSQTGNATARYRFLVKAKIDQGTLDMGEFYSSPPLATSTRPGRLSRMVASAVCPGAIGWTVEVNCVPPINGEPPAETADIKLASSKCSTAPVGVVRVGERYDYDANTVVGGSQNFIVLPGMRVTGIAAIGLTGGGTLEVDSGATIVVPEGVGVNLEPGTTIAPNVLITFGNVSWVVEYMESA